MRYAPILLAAAISATSASETAAPGQNAIAEILTGASSWSVFLEFTQGDTPSDRANRLGWQFFRRGSAVIGRTTNMLAGMNCDFEVAVRDNGIDVSYRARGCMDRPDTSMLQLDYDPADRRFPFKHTATPLRWWMSPNP